MAKILMVDDDRNIRELVAVLLRRAGHETTEAPDGNDAMERLASAVPDMAVIDAMTPRMNGYELCRSLRKSYPAMPVLMLTAKAEGFEAGADDYLPKPFEGDELAMRVRALLRRRVSDESRILKVGSVTVDLDCHTVNGADMPLKEFELLFKLAGAPGRTFYRGSLIEEVWGFDFEGNERTLGVHVSRLRERFPEKSSGFRITAVRGLGYRLEVCGSD